MSRPPGTGGATFAQFFPAAPRAAKDRAMERERGRRTAESPSSNPAADQNGRRTPAPRPDEGAVTSRSRRDGSASDIAHPATDDSESVQGDTLNTVGSASSHASTSSSVFSTSARQNGLAAAKASNSQFTPLTTVESPSYSISPNPTKPSTSTPQYPDKVNGFASKPAGATNISPAPDGLSAIQRIPARDPSVSVKGIKCTYDPLLDRSISSSEKKKAKPIYKEFGSVCTSILYSAGRGSVVFHENKLANKTLLLGR